MHGRVSRKVLGERAECAFLSEAMERGLIVSKPYGDSAPYDFIVEKRRIHRRERRGRGERLGQRSKATGKRQGRARQKEKGKRQKAKPRQAAGGRLWKVQVKSVGEEDGQGRYLVHTCRSGSRAYAAGEVDCFAAWVKPQNAWYIIPAETVTGTCVHLYPQRPASRGKYEKYREAWRLLGAVDSE